MTRNEPFDVAFTRLLHDIAAAGEPSPNALDKIRARCAARRGWWSRIWARLNPTPRKEDI